jgi:hypothetical protein
MMAFVDVTVLCSSLFEVMVEIELPKNLACKHKKNLLNVISYRCLWRNQCKSVQIPDTLCMMPEKLKAHNDFGQGNNFQGSLKSLAAQYKQKSMGLPVYGPTELIIPI